MSNSTLSYCFYRPVGRASNMCSETKQNILNAARSLFAAYGFSVTTMDDIARAAGIKKATLYHHFESKESLLKEILESVAYRLSEQLQDIADTPGDTTQRLKRVIQVVIDNAQHNPEIHVLTMLAVSDVDSRAVTKFVWEIKQRLFIQLKNTIIKIDPCHDQNEQTALLISFTILGMVVNSHLVRDTAEIKQVIERFLAVIDHHRQVTITK
jgi:AcrR family transcriptional regulator